MSAGATKKVRWLVVLRGLPGSGKTTLANELCRRCRIWKICTEDKYHWSGGEDGVGTYTFRPDFVVQARQLCSEEIRSSIQKHIQCIVLDNHNARMSMYEDHIRYAIKHGYRIRIIEIVTTDELIDCYFQRSTKGFTKDVFVKLFKYWEKDPRAKLVNPQFESKKLVSLEKFNDQTKKKTENDEDVYENDTQTGLSNGVG
ncbi:NEDD4-binding protein [Reticulomyxa filosa]|uniref:NEDD4-binding protein n=1 Tax=Reticulomyxa filosa TaxID=46433 RepID=X6LZN4_RETFI|nr:NEDD4-binding protein [Reticulomyxa filosa]|eukprot:ETO06622.1 NEDD4-binding protein [Reticulomyxa filosa]